MPELSPSAINSLLRSCAKYRWYDEGRSIHCHILKQRTLYLNLYLQNLVLNFYAKCGEIESAHKLFLEMPQRNTVSWTALISGYDQCGKSQLALEIFSNMIMQDKSSTPNEFTCSSAISACSKLQCLIKGMQVHSHAIRRGFFLHVMVTNALISLYMACGHVSKAELVFEETQEPDEISWNSLISGFAHNGFMRVSLEWFSKMRESQVKLTSFSLSSILTACLAEEIDGRRFHGHAIKTGLDSDCFLGTSLMRMYSKYQSDKDAFRVFQMLSFKDLASWNSLIETYGECGQGEKGLQVLSTLLATGQKVDHITVISTLGISSKLILLDYGRQLHSLSLKTGLGERIEVSNSIIDMYAKCGCLEDSLRIFRQMQERNIISWTTIMGGFAYHGKSEEVFQFLEAMNKEGLKPNKITYTCVLSACSHRGLVDLGKTVFKSMDIEPESEHHVSMVHLLAGTGRFEEAENFIENSTSEYREKLWQCFLAACKNFGEWKRGVEVAKRILELNLFTESHTLVLLSNIFAGGGKWEYVELVRKKMKERGLKKEPACSWIEIDNRFQVFGMNRQLKF